jgi:uncharacterized protein
MKRIAIILTLLFTLPLGARADDASRHAKAQEMVTLLHLDKLLAQVMDVVMTQANAMSKQLGGETTPEQQAKLDAFQKKAFALIDTQLGWKTMQPVYVDLYAKAFTDEELDGILAFYKSPAGVAMIEKTPALTAQSQQIALQKIQAIQPQMKQLVEDFKNGKP